MELAVELNKHWENEDEVKMTNKCMKNVYYPGLLGKSKSVLYFDSTSPQSELLSSRK